MNSINGVNNGYSVHRSRSGGCRGRVAKEIRRLIAVDIENLVGGACVHRHQVDWAKSVLADMLSLGSSDHVVVGLSHIGLLNVGCNWPHIRYVVRSGSDGADLALLDVLAEDVSIRFDEVVIASGDGIFAEAMAGLVRAGVETTVMARQGGLARSLRNVASQVLYVPEPPPADDMALTETETARIRLDRIDWRAERLAGTAPRSARENQEPRASRRPRQRSHSATVRSQHRAAA